MPSSVEPKILGATKGGYLWTFRYTTTCLIILRESQTGARWQPLGPIQLALGLARAACGTNLVIGSAGAVFVPYSATGTVRLQHLG